MFKGSSALCHEWQSPGVAPVASAQTFEADVGFCSHLAHFSASLQKERVQRETRVGLQRKARPGTGTDLERTWQAESWGSLGEGDHTQKGDKGTKPKQSWVNSKQEKDKSQHSTEDKIRRPKEGKKSLGEAYDWAGENEKTSDDQGDRK